MPVHKHVLKNPRRTVLVDDTGFINAYIQRDDDVFFEEGDTISVEVCLFVGAPLRRI